MNVRIRSYPVLHETTTKVSNKSKESPERMHACAAVGQDVDALQEIVEHIVTLKLKAGYNAQILRGVIFGGLTAAVVTLLWALLHNQLGG